MIRSFTNINWSILRQSWNVEFVFCVSKSICVRGASRLVRDLPEGCEGHSTTPKGLVLGVHCDSDDHKGVTLTFTETAKKFDNFLEGRLKKLVLLSLPPPALGEVRLYYGLEATFNAIAVVGLGSRCLGYNPVEEIDEQKEVIRIASAAGARALQDLDLPKIYVESFGHAESAAEGANLGVWMYQENKSPDERHLIPKLELYDSCEWVSWDIGKEKAAAQNMARHFMETPANILTPASFALNAVEVLTKAGVNAEVKVKKWAKIRNLNAFLAVASGSCQPPIFLEASYEGCDPNVAPAVLVGKGTTFDSGGLCNKTPEELERMRGDMCGAAVVVAAVRAISNLQIPINIRALIPLCENMPGTCAYKPGDIITAMNGKSILVQATSNEGRLMLADALCYAAYFNPKFIVDVGTLSEESGVALGTSAVAAFSNSNTLYDLIRVASIHTGDRIWRMPLWEHYSQEVTDSERSDVLNVGRSGHGGGCAAAAFLQEFVPKCTDWIHLDCYGTSWTNGCLSYLRQGMSGRPTRTLVEFLSQLGCASSQENREELANFN